MLRKYTKGKTAVKKRVSYKKAPVRRRTSMPRIAMLRPEIKWITGNQTGTSTVGTSGTTDFTVLGVSNLSIPLINVATPSMGSGPHQRIGNSITLYSLDLRYQFVNLQASLADFRVIVFLDRLCTGTQPNTQDLLSVGATSDLLKMSFYPVDPVKESRFKVLADQHYALDPFGTGQSKVLHLKVPVRNLVMRFSKPGGDNNSTYPDLVGNWIGIAVIPSQNIANSDGVKVSGISCLKYTDA